MSMHNEQPLPEIPLAGPAFEPENPIRENLRTLRLYVELAVGLAAVTVVAGLHITWKEARDAELKALRDRDATNSNDEWWGHDQNSQRWSRVRGAIEDGIDPDPDDLK
ncbi:MAG: hypothetical protein ABWX94_00265 [Candidatus Saccharimonadales bacterium]